MVEALTDTVITDRWFALAGRVIGLRPRDIFIKEALTSVEYTVRGRILPPERITRALNLFCEKKERPLLECLDRLARRPDRASVISPIKEWFDGCSLNGRDKRATSLRFGLDSDLYDADHVLDPMTFKEIGSQFGITRQGAHHIVTRAFVKLQIGLALELDSTKHFLEYLQG